MRPNFSSILSTLNSLLDIEYDLEVIAQTNRMDLLQKGLEEGKINQNVTDSLGRTLVHQCCIFGNLEMLKYLTDVWGTECLSKTDQLNTSMTHFASRNGHLDILKFLRSKDKLSCEKERRFEITGVDLLVAMKHLDCLDFISDFVTKEALGSALYAACNEGKFEIVKKVKMSKRK